MARKKIREYDGKRLLFQYLKKLAGLNMPPGRCALVTMYTNWEKLKREQPWLTNTKLVVKPDMLFGQRGKHGLVLLNATIDEVQQFVEEK